MYVSWKFSGKIQNVQNKVLVVKLPFLQLKNIKIHTDWSWINSIDTMLENLKEKRNEKLSVFNMFITEIYISHQIPIFPVKIIPTCCSKKARKWVERNHLTKSTKRKTRNNNILMLVMIVQQTWWLFFQQPLRNQSLKLPKVKVTNRPQEGQATQALEKMSKRPVLLRSKLRCNNKKPRNSTSWW